jgi:hypothetical protein
MRWLTALCLATLLASAGCRSAATSETTPSPEPFTPPAGRMAVILTKAPNPYATNDVRIEIYADGALIGSGVYSDSTYQEAIYADATKNYLREHKTPVAIHANAGVCYADAALAMLTFTKIGVNDFDLGGARVYIPNSTEKSVNTGIVKDPVILPVEEACPQPYVSIRLYDVGPAGEYNPDGPNDWLSILVAAEARDPKVPTVINTQKDLVATEFDTETLPFARGRPEDGPVANRRMIEALTAHLKELRAHGTPADRWVCIRPTMACQPSWVSDACKAADAACFKNIRLGIPYE